VNSRPREKIYAVALQNLFLATMLEIDRLEPHETSTLNILPDGAVKFEDETVETAVAHQLGDPEWIR